MEQQVTGRDYSTTSEGFLDMGGNGDGAGNSDASKHCPVLSRKRASRDQRDHFWAVSLAVGLLVHVTSIRPLLHAVTSNRGGTPLLSGLAEQAICRVPSTPA